MNCSALMHIKTALLAVWLVLWPSDEWGLSSMTTVSFLPICHLLREPRVKETTWQHVAQYGRAWYSAGWLELVCWSVCVLPGTCRGGKLSSITRACMCQATGKLHNPRALTHSRDTGN